jgi:hypothetical protein
MDALNAPEEAPAGDESTVPVDDGISRDEIPLSGACIVNADCTSDTFCRLGRCVSECSAETPCAAGLSCSARGKCTDKADYIDANPPVLKAMSASIAVDVRAIRLDANEHAASFQVSAAGGSLQYRVQVEPTSAAEAVTVSSTKGVLASGGSAELNVDVDRSAFGAGDHSVIVSVVTDGGQKNVIVDFSNGIDGRYAGFVNYEDPGLGRVPLVVDIKADASGAIAGRIVAEGSLLFPEARALTGTYDAAQSTVFLSSADLYEEGGVYDPFERDVGREIYFFGDAKQQRVLSGTFEELISGLLPNLLSVEGDFYLKRTDADVSDIALPANPAMPGYGVPATAYAHCDGASATCNDFISGFPVDMVGCSTALRSSAYQLADRFSGTNAQGDPVVKFGLVEECKSDVAHAGTGVCVHVDDLSCLRRNQQHFLLSALPQNAEYREYFKDLEGMQRLFAFIGNDLLVDAYRTSVETVTSPLGTELMRLEDALAKFGKAERAFFETGNIEILGRASSSLISEDSFALLRVPIEYMRSSQAALQRIASLTMRRDIEWPAKRDALRQRIQEHARVIYLEGLILARLINMHGGAFENELAQVGDELRSAAHTASVLEAGVNPMGFTNDYVPFIYDPADALHATNFAQLVEMARSTVESAVQKADLANGTAELMEVRTDEIAERMESIQQNYESQIQQICGIDSLDLLGECGASGGELSVAFSDIEQQYIGIEKTHQQILDLNEMVKIKRDAALQIMRIKNNTLVFLSTTGAEMEALDIAEGEIRAAMLRRSGFFSFIGGMLGGVANIAGGLSGLSLIGEKFFNPGSVVGGVAGGLSGMVNAGLGLASSAQSAASAMRFAEVASRRTHLRNLQQMRLKEEEIEVTAIQSAEAVKMLLVQMAELNLELAQAEVRLEQLITRANNLLERVDFLKHQHDVLMAQVAQSVNNPLSNLSFRLKRDHAVLVAAEEFEKALSDVYLVARGLEHELNVNLPQIESQLFQSNSASQVRDFLTCLSGWYGDYALAFGSPHEEVTQLSLREDILGFAEPVTDEVTGEITPPQELFRRVLLNPKNLTTSGRVQFPFTTNIYGDNKQFSTLVCNDRIRSIRVQLVGDFLGDNQAVVMLKQEGDSRLRDCASNPEEGADVVSDFHLDARTALVQAGVNSFGIASPNFELTGRSVASDRWLLVIPTGSEAPVNADVDVLNIDDVIIEITHTARTLSGSNPTNVFDQCNI